MGIINCCNGCVPPERNPYCHTYCEKYITAKEEYAKKKAVEDKKRDITIGLNNQMSEGVEKAYKAQRRRKGRFYGR